MTGITVAAFYLHIYFRKRKEECHRDKVRLRISR